VIATEQADTLPKRLHRLAALHCRAKDGGLERADLDLYHTERATLVRVLVARQPLEPGQLPRRSLRVSCHLTALIDFGDQTEPGTTVDISTGGCAVLLDHHRPVGFECQAAISIPGGEPVRARARVVYVRPDAHRFRVGIEFTSMSGSDTERLDLLVFDTLLELLV